MIQFIYLRSKRGSNGRSIILRPRGKASLCGVPLRDFYERILRENRNWLSCPNLQRNSPEKKPEEQLLRQGISDFSITIFFWAAQNKPRTQEIIAFLVSGGLPRRWWRRHVHVDEVFSLGHAEVFLPVKTRSGGQEMRSGRSSQFYDC